jgi:hypothetical protein
MFKTTPEIGENRGKELPEMMKFFMAHPHLAKHILSSKIYTRNIT